MKLMMKRRLRDAAIHTGAVISRLVNADEGGRIIALHDVPDAAQFRRKLEWLCSHYNIVSLETLLLNNARDNKKSVALTFDDGYENWLKNAVPAIEEFRIPAVFFVCSGLVGLEGRAAQEFVCKQLWRRQQLAPISRAALLEIAEHPLFEIGGHTCNHVNLGEITGVDELIRQIDVDKQRLTDWTGRSILWFAYPFGGCGNWNRGVQDVVRRCGYKAAFTILPSPVRSVHDSYAIGRDCLDLDAPEKLWRDWLDGGYDKISNLKMRYFVRL